jgi:hypothetical protein
MEVTLSYTAWSTGNRKGTLKIKHWQIDDFVTIQESKFASATINLRPW